MLFTSYRGAALFSMCFLLSWSMVLYITLQTPTLSYNYDNHYEIEMIMENNRRNKNETISRNENETIPQNKNETTTILHHREDSCRGFAWDEVIIPSPGASDACSNYDNKVNQGTLINTTTLERQMIMILESIEPYTTALMKPLSNKNHTVIVIPNAIFLETKAIDTKFDITLTTHMGAVGKYHRFLVLIQRWNGPVSIAIKFTNMDEIHHFHKFIINHQPQLQRVSFHYYIEFHQNTNTTTTKPAYPHNILRNLAMTNICTNYFFVNDVDIFPSPVNTHEKLKSLIMSQDAMQKGLSTQTMYVVPMFDFHTFIAEDDLVYNHKLFPNEKEDVIRMNATGILSQHHLDVHPIGHRAVNFDKWFANQTAVSYEIEHEHKFEPYVIGSKQNNDVPLFYPYFQGYGLDKYSWYDELAWSGFKLQVLRDFYMFHAKHESSYGDVAARKQLFEINKVCARGFLTNVATKHDLSSFQDNIIWDAWILQLCDRKIKLWPYYLIRDKELRRFCINNEQLRKTAIP